MGKLTLFLSNETTRKQRLTPSNSTLLVVVTLVDGRSARDERKADGSGEGNAGDHLEERLGQGRKRLKVSVEREEVVEEEEGEGDLVLGEETEPWRVEPAYMLFERPSELSRLQRTHPACRNRPKARSAVVLLSYGRARKGIVVRPSLSGKATTFACWLHTSTSA